MDVYIPIDGSIHAVHVRLCQGDITRQSTDAIVNFRPSWFRERASGISMPSSGRHIMEAAGRTVEREYWAMRVKGSDLTATPTVVTSGGNLRQKQIYHLKHFYEPRELRKAMISSLSLADEDQMKSIVIPVFDCSKNLQQLVSSLYQSFNDFIRHHQPKHLHHIIIVVPDRRMENFYLAVRDLWESSVLVDVMYKEPMREVLEATGMICKTTDRMYDITLNVRYMNDEEDEDCIPKQDKTHAVVGFCTDGDGDEEDEQFFMDHYRYANAHNIERWYTQKVQSEPECENGMAELAEINMALNKLGFPGSWGDEQTSIATTKKSLVFVFYEGIRFELANRSPYTYQIVDDIRAPAKHIWLRNMIQKSLRLADQRGFTEITFVVKRTVCGTRTDALYVVEGVNSFSRYYNHRKLRTVNIVTPSGIVFDAFKAGRRLHTWIKEPGHLECRHHQRKTTTPATSVISNTASISLPFHGMMDDRKVSIVAIIVAIIGSLLIYNKYFEYS